MITLITGSNGTGKTAYLVNEMVKLLKAEIGKDHHKFVAWFLRLFFDATKPPSRPLFVHGIKELKIPHTPIYCRDDLCDICRSNIELVNWEQRQDRAQDVDKFLYAEDWPRWKQTGALIIIDEIQRIWPPSNSTNRLPEALSLMQTHRSYGVDFWIISQDPSLFHKNIRTLVGLHIHLLSTWNGRQQYEWPFCKDNVQSTGNAVARPYKLPSEIFHLYKSADMHTKLKKRMPLAVYAFAACIVVMVGLSVHIYQRYSEKFEESDKVALTTDSVSVPTGEGGALAAALPVSTAPVIQNSSYPDFKPTVEGVPESAPAYSELLKVTAVPLLVGCVYSKTTDVCSCYTAQATPYPASKEYCMAQIKNKRFNPYLQPQSVQTVQKQPDEQSSQSSKKDDKTEPS